jgi:xanthine dehydrogenase/oxidase
MPAFRQTLVASFLVKFVATVTHSLTALCTTAKVSPPLPVDAREESAAVNFLSQDRPLSHGVQRFEVPSGGLLHGKAGKKLDLDPNADPTRAPVGQPLPHASALLQCVGEAKYVDDMPDPSGCLHTAVVLSTQAHARIVSIDTTAAEAMPGVVKVFTAKDLTLDRNAMGPVIYDEELFRRETVTSTGQTVAAVVAESVEIARAAAKLVKVEYIALPAVVSIDEAIAADSFHAFVNSGPKAEIEDGYVDQAFERADVTVVTGEVRVGGQEHFYLECNAALVIPGEGDELEVLASTQAAAKTQKFAARVCGVRENSVVCKVKRMGGAFGGKETRTVW